MRAVDNATALTACFDSFGTAQWIRVPVAAARTHRIARPGVAVLIGTDKKPSNLILGKLTVVEFMGACDHQDLSRGERGKAVKSSHAFLSICARRRTAASGRDGAKTYGVAMRYGLKSGTSAVQKPNLRPRARQRIERSFIV